MYSVQILSKYLNLLLKEEEEEEEWRGISASMSSSQGQELDVNLFKEKDEKSQ